MFWLNTHQTLIFLCIYPLAVADPEEWPKGPLGKTKLHNEKKSAGQAKNPSLAKGVDPPLICTTEALLASAVSCRMISMPVLISATEARRLV